MTGAPFEQGSSKVVLQALDEPAEGRLGHAQPLGRAPEVEFLGEGQEGCGVVDVHGLAFPRGRRAPTNASGAYV